MAYLLGSTVVFNLLPQIQDILQIIDILLNLLVLYFLTFHINSESKKLRIITLLSAIFSFLKDIVFIFIDFFVSKNQIELKIDEIGRNISYAFLYVLIIYYGYEDYKLFGSGLKKYLKEGHRSRLGSGGRIKIK